MSNPFDVTKAVDFSDEQIEATWVDLPGGGFSSLADPRSPMPVFLVGGKGGGRTHLLRYYSFALQKLRHGANLAAGVSADGYVGMYFRCAGLNSSRFSGKRQSSETWSAVFSYYTELWLGRLTLDLVDEFRKVSPDSVPDREIYAMVDEIASLFDSPLDSVGGDTASRDLQSLRNEFQSRQRVLDVAINNAALTGSLSVEIGASPGRLVFGVPRAVERHVSVFRGVVFAYLIDEFENLSIEQQRYVNTLVREKELPTTFVIGSRLFGLRTHQTLAAGEENRRGSEFDLVILEEQYRSQSNGYKSFCTRIVQRRLGATEGDGATVKLAELFEPAAPPGSSSIEDRARVAVDLALKGRNRPWLARLERQLTSFDSGLDVRKILRAVAVDASPLHEKFAVLMLYRAWADRKDLATEAEAIAVAVRGLLDESESDQRLWTSYKHYKFDLYAQIRFELKLPQEYLGFDEFVRMSGYLPRNLLVVLKQMSRWSTFRGEGPFSGGQISRAAQIEGVREASAWFLSDAKGLGEIGMDTEFAIRRLGSFFREARFSEKPVEVSCSAFSSDRQGLSARAMACLEDAVAHSLLLEVPVGRKERNSHVLHYKYQLNPMLAPQFDLSLALRGSMSFAAADMNAIFDVSDDAGFRDLRRRVLGRMRAPFRGVPLADADLLQTPLELE